MMQKLFALVREGKLLTRVDPATGESRVVTATDKTALEAEPGDKILPVEDQKLVSHGVLHEGSPTIELRKGRAVRVFPHRDETADEKTARVAAARRAAYPAIGDQLDAIAKAFITLDAKSLPAETREWLARIEAVKAAHPKP